MIKTTDKIDGYVAMQLVTNISIATARRYINIAKQHYGKVKHQFLSVGEFCEYYGIRLNEK